MCFAWRAAARKEDIMTTCTKCSGEMQRAAEAGSGTPFGAIALGLVGVPLLFVVPAGTVIGILLIVTALVLGYPRKKVWKCPQCGFEHV
jgi:hypothetical protein